VLSRVLRGMTVDGLKQEVSATSIVFCFQRIALGPLKGNVLVRTGSVSVPMEVFWPRREAFWPGWEVFWLPNGKGHEMQAGQGFRQAFVVASKVAKARHPSEAAFVNPGSPGSRPGRSRAI
jgi:hypothetical protein